MKINLKELLEGKRDTVEFHIDEIIDEMDYLGDRIKFVTPIVFRGKVTHTDDQYFIQATIETTAVLTCSRCLKEFHQNIMGAVNVQLITEELIDAQSDDYFIISNGSVDASEIIEDALVMALPMKIVCDEHCKGLCRKCGVNLNASGCNCEASDIDPRLAKLKELLQQD